MAAAGRWILPGVRLNLVIIAAASIPLALFFYFSLSFEQGLEKFIGFNALYLVNAGALVLLLIPRFFARGNVTFAVTACSLNWIPTSAPGLDLLAPAGHPNIRLGL